MDPQIRVGRRTLNAASDVSVFGGHPLWQARRVAGLESGYAADEESPLAALGIDDAEQLVAIAAIPSVVEALQEHLGVSTGDLEEAVEAARSALPPERAILMSRPATAEFGLGVLEPTADVRARIRAAEEEMVVTGPEADALPASANLIPMMPPIRNQGQRGTCVAFTLTALNEYALRLRNLREDLSEQHLYHEIKLIDGSPGGCGTWQAKAVNALRDRG